MKLRFSFLVLLEAQPPSTRSVQPQLSQPSQSRSSHLRRLDAHFRLGRTHSRILFHPLAQPPHRAGEGEPKTFRILPEPRSSEPWAAASFNPGM